MARRVEVDATDMPLEDVMELVEEYEGMDNVEVISDFDMTRPSERQIGGNHYKDFPIQPSQFCERNKLTHLESNAIKYICRAHVKGKEPVQDLRKAKHCIDMILEWEYGYVDHPATARPRSDSGSR